MVLDRYRVIDADAANRRHDVRCVSYQQQPRSVPAFHPAGFHREDGDLFPFCDGLHAVRESWHQFTNVCTQVFQAVGLDLLIAAFGNSVADLPLLAPVELDEDVPLADTQFAVSSLWVSCLARQPKPEYVHGGRVLDWLETCQLAHARETSIGSYRQNRSQFVPAILGAILHAMNIAVLLDELFRARTHDQAEIGIAFCFLGNACQELSLGNKRNIRKACLQAFKAKIRDDSLW